LGGVGIGAGVAGSGISSYIDNVLLRDKDTSAASSVALSAIKLGGADITRYMGGGSHQVAKPCLMAP
jgi:hypothetical protein